MIQTVFRITAWASLFAIFIFTDGPIFFRPTTGLSPNTERLLALMVVGALFSLAYPKRPWVVLALLLIAIAVFEFLQFSSLGRHANIIDVGYKCVGALSGVTAGWLVNQIQSTRLKK